MFAELLLCLGKSQAGNWLSRLHIFRVGGQISYRIRKTGWKPDVFQRRSERYKERLGRSRVLWIGEGRVISPRRCRTDQAASSFLMAYPFTVSTNLAVFLSLQKALSLLY